MKMLERSRSFEIQNEMFDNEEIKPVRDEFQTRFHTFMELEKGVYEKSRFLDILKKYNFDIGHIIFGYGKRNNLLLELVDMKETNDLK